MKRCKLRCHRDSGKPEFDNAWWHLIQSEQMGRLRTCEQRANGGSHVLFFLFIYEQKHYKMTNMIPKNKHINLTCRCIFSLVLRRTVLGQALVVFRSMHSTQIDPPSSVPTNVCETEHSERHIGYKMPATAAANAGAVLGNRMVIHAGKLIHFLYW